MRWVSWALFGFGALVCALNFAFTAGRFALHRLRRTRTEFRYISPVPFVGTLAVVLGWWNLEAHVASRAFDAAALTCVALDVGGPHMFLAAMLYARAAATRR